MIAQMPIPRLLFLFHLKTACWMHLNAKRVGHVLSA